MTCGTADPTRSKMQTLVELQPTASPVSSFTQIDGISEVGQALACHGRGSASFALYNGIVAVGVLGDQIVLDDRDLLPILQARPGLQTSAQPRRTRHRDPDLLRNHGLYADQRLDRPQTDAAELPADLGSWSASQSADSPARMNCLRISRSCSCNLPVHERCAGRCD